MRRRRQMSVPMLMTAVAGGAVAAAVAWPTPYTGGGSPLALPPLLPTPVSNGGKAPPVEGLDRIGVAPDGGGAGTSGHPWD